jgi:hypothetical protein
MSARPAGFDQAVEVMARAICVVSECDADTMAEHRWDATRALTALLAERVETPCPECEGSRTVTRFSQYDAQMQSEPCPTCHGKVGSDVPLIVMGSELEAIGWRSDAADAGPRWTIDPALVALDRNRGWYPVYRVRAS